MRILPFLLAALSFFVSPVFAESLAERFHTGEGSKFALSLEGLTNADLRIYVAESKNDTVNIETHFALAALGGVELWQQTQLRRNGNQISTGDAYLLAAPMTAPERFNPLEVAPQAGGWSDFLFPKVDAKGTPEKIHTEAGVIQATRHSLESGGTRYEFWVSDQARPIGLVKLVATGKTQFSLQLQSLLSNVKRKIDPATAVPLSPIGRLLLPGKNGLPSFP